MAHVPEATYRMGCDVGEPDERPVHTVHVAAFDLDLTEVTVGEYAACVHAGECVPAPTTVQFPGVTADDHRDFDGECHAGRPEREKNAQNCVDWAMAAAYCHWAGKRLPTEEEWEYAACAGNCDEAVRQRGGVTTILGAEHWPVATRVAETKPGPFGLYDMADNAWEWTASAYCLYERAGCGDARRVIRGGSWAFADLLRVRLTDRGPSDATTRTPVLGFRCAR